MLRVNVIRASGLLRASKNASAFRMAALSRNFSSSSNPPLNLTEILPVSTHQDTEETLTPTLAPANELLLDDNSNETVTNVLAGTTVLDVPSTWSKVQQYWQAIDANKADLMAKSTSYFGFDYPWIPTVMIQKYFSLLEPFVPMGWTGSIVLGVVAFRAVIFPVFVSQMGASARAAQYQPQSMAMLQQVQKEAAAGNAQEAQRLQADRLKFLTEKKIRLRDIMASALITGPVFCMTFFALKNEGFLNSIPEMKSAGALSFVDLTAVDPYYLLPGITSASVFLTMYLAPVSENTPVLMKTVMKILQFSMPGIMLLASSSLPAATTLYWATNSVFTLGQSIILRDARFRKMVGLPTLKEIELITAKNMQQAQAMQLSMANLTQMSNQKPTKEETTPESKNKKSKKRGPPRR